MLAPPKTTAGCPAYLPRPASSQGGVRLHVPPMAFSPEWYRATADVASASGMVAAWSKEMLGGIYVHRAVVRCALPSKFLP